jgi:ribonucleoside-diphosphate reductase beta chain
MTTKHIVFNEDKMPEDYMVDSPLFFGKPQGLFNTVYKPYPKIWSLYKKMKSLDWSENEFDYSQCLMDFKNCPKEVSDMMIRTLAWQWEADSVASRAIAPVLAPFISDSSLWAAWQRVSDNEVVHSATYSEIVRMSFDNPENVLADILSVQESYRRMDVVNSRFDKLYTASHKYALGMITPDEAYDDMFLGIVALLLLERIQFSASFAITFTICSLNWFQPAGKAIQKICQDELEVHVELDKEVLRTELATERGSAAYTRNKGIIKKMVDEVVECELTWVEYLFSEGRELVGATPNMVKDWVLYNARDVYTFFDITPDHKLPKTNPMPSLEKWININLTQAAPQEQDNNQYKVNMIVRDDEAVDFDVDF